MAGVTEGLRLVRPVCKVSPESQPLGVGLLRSDGDEDGETKSGSRFGGATRNDDNVLMGDGAYDEARLDLRYSTKELVTNSNGSITRSKLRSEFGSWIGGNWERRRRGFRERKREGEEKSMRRENNCISIMSN